MVFNLLLFNSYRALFKLPGDFTTNDLKKAYRRMVGEWHPDRHRQTPDIIREATAKTQAFTVAHAYLEKFFQDYLISAQAKNVSIKVDKTPSIKMNPKSRLKRKPPEKVKKTDNFFSGFPDPAVAELTLNSLHISSVGYDSESMTLYIKFPRNIVHRYHNVPKEVYRNFLRAKSPSKYAKQEIYPRFTKEVCY